MRIQPIPCLKDNYAYLVVCDTSGESAIVDASEAGPVVAAARAAGAKPRDIWATHHHMDHVGGNEEVARSLGVKDITGHVSDMQKGRIPGQTKAYDTGEEFRLGELTIRTFHIPGHTLGAIAYVVSDGDETAAFTGDTLFCAGCGRLFEGTPAQMHASLTLLAGLGPKVKVYCGHEYTENNLRFAKHVEPKNHAIDQAMQRAKGLRAAGQPTVPTSMADELSTNPFLRTSSPEIRATLDIAEGADGAVALAAIRRAKDTF